MTGWAALDRLLDTDPSDAGCAHAMEVLHVYAELIATGRDASVAHPTVVAHIAACGPCAEDLDGLLAAIQASAQER